MPPKKHSARIAFAKPKHTHLANGVARGGVGELPSQHLGWSTIERGAKKLVPWLSHTHTSFMLPRSALSTLPPPQATWATGHCNPHLVFHVARSFHYRPGALRYVDAATTSPTHPIPSNPVPSSVRCASTHARTFRPRVRPTSTTVPNRAQRIWIPRPAPRPTIGPRVRAYRTRPRGAGASQPGPPRKSPSPLRDRNWLCSSGRRVRGAWARAPFGRALLSAVSSPPTDPDARCAICGPGVWRLAEGGGWRVAFPC